MNQGEQKPSRKRWQPPLTSLLFHLFICLFIYVFICSFSLKCFIGKFIAQFLPSSTWMWAPPCGLSVCVLEVLTFPPLDLLISWGSYQKIGGILLLNNKTEAGVFVSQHREFLLTQQSFALFRQTLPPASLIHYFPETRERRLWCKVF